MNIRWIFLRPFIVIVTITTAWTVFLLSAGVKLEDVHTDRIAQIMFQYDFSAAAVFIGAVFVSMVHPSLTSSVAVPSPESVYLIRADNGLFKIGRTSNVKRRLANFRTSIGVTLIHTVNSPDSKILESFLHKYFATKRVRGEWFQLDDNDVAYIKGLQ